MASQSFFSNTKLVEQLVKHVIVLQHQRDIHPQRHQSIQSVPGTICSRSIRCNPSMEASLPCALDCPTCLRHFADHTSQDVSGPMKLQQQHLPYVSDPGRNFSYLVSLAKVSRAFYLAVAPVLWNHVDWTVTLGAPPCNRFVHWLEMYLTEQAISHAQNRGGQSLGGGACVRVLQMSRSVWSLLHRMAFEILGKAFPNVACLELLEDSVDINADTGGQDEDRDAIIFGAGFAQEQQRLEDGSADQLAGMLMGAQVSDRIRLDSDQANGWNRPRLEDLARCFPNLKSLILPEGGLTMVAMSSSNDAVGDKRRILGGVEPEEGSVSRKRLCPNPTTQLYQPQSRVGSTSGTRACLSMQLYRPHSRSGSSGSRHGFSSGFRSSSSSSTGTRQDLGTSMPLLEKALTQMHLEAEETDGRFGNLEYVSCSFDPQSLENLDRILHDLCFSCLDSVQIRARPKNLLWLVTKGCPMSQGSYGGYGSEGAAQKTYLDVSIKLVYRVLAVTCPKDIIRLSIPDLDALAVFANNWEVDEGQFGPDAMRPPESRQPSYGYHAMQAIKERHYGIAQSFIVQQDQLNLTPWAFFV
ncbi:hypothetical protein BGX29_002264 [Mortierella sp. GBA35]|nr:hypothetical protein BGX29_002264 [Mortierella sp. GBA35]